MVKVTTLALFASFFLLLIIPLLIFPSYSQTNVNNTNPLDQGNVSITEDRSPSLDNTSRISFVFKFKWGSFGTGNDQFRRPHDVAFDSKGFVRN
jgi:hypothetical protein